jgi:hypothetical protein
MVGNKRWTKEDKQLGIKQYKKGTELLVIQRRYFPERTPKAVINMLEREGVWCRKKHFKEEELNTIRKIVLDGGTYHDCSKACPGRAVHTIQNLFRRGGKLHYLSRGFRGYVNPRSKSRRPFVREPTHPLKFTREQVQRARGELVA